MSRWRREWNCKTNSLLPLQSNPTQPSEFGRTCQEMAACPPTFISGYRGRSDVSLCPRKRALARAVRMPAKGERVARLGRGAFTARCCRPRKSRGQRLHHYRRRRSPSPSSGGRWQIPQRQLPGTHRASCSRGAVAIASTCASHIPRSRIRPRHSQQRRPPARDAA